MRCRNHYGLKVSINASMIFGLVFLFTLPARPFNVPEVRAAEPKNEDALKSLIEKTALRLKNELGITLHYDGKDFPYVGPGKSFTVKAEKPTLKEVAAYLPVLWELFQYPKSYIKASSLEKVLLCRDLQFSDKACNQPRMAVPVFSKGTLIYDVKAVVEINYALGVLHHEYYHLADWDDDGLVYEDKEWVKLNPKDFRYGSGGKDMRTGNVTALTDKIPGFLNKYGTSGVEEDKAELISNIFINPEFVKERAEKDESVKAKIELMKKQLEKISPDIDANFWTAREEKHKKDLALEALFDEVGRKGGKAFLEKYKGKEFVFDAAFWIRTGEEKQADYLRACLRGKIRTFKVEYEEAKEAVLTNELPDLYRLEGCVKDMADYDDPLTGRKVKAPVFTVATFGKK